MSSGTDISRAQAGGRLARQGVEPGPIGLGCLGLGNYPAVLDHTQAGAIVDAAWDSGIRLFDTAPLYGRGLSERRLGVALAGRDRDVMVICTKIGRRLRPSVTGHFQPDVAASIFVDPAPFDTEFDYSYDGAMWSMEDSLQRLGTSRIDVVHIHNIDPAVHDPATLEQMFAECMSGAYKAMVAMREQGVIRAIGVGNNSVPMLQRFVQAGDFDCLMMAGHYTLLDQSADRGLLELCQQRGIGILLGAPFESGVLATGASPTALHGYKALDRDTFARLQVIEQCCQRWNVPLVSAALQFPLRHPAVACVVPGASTAQQVLENIAAIRRAPPDGFWQELDPLVRRTDQLATAAG